MKNIKRDRFEKVAGNRVNNILKALDSLEKCSNKTNYQYSDKDVKKMEKALRDKLNDVLKSFSSSVQKEKDVAFKF